MHAPYCSWSSLSKQRGCLFSLTMTFFSSGSTFSEISPKIPHDLRKKTFVTVLLVLCAGDEKVCGIFISSPWHWLDDPASAFCSALSFNFRFQIVATARCRCTKPCGFLCNCLRVTTDYRKQRCILHNEVVPWSLWPGRDGSLQFYSSSVTYFTCVR